MKTISTLTNNDVNEAYQIELLCHPIPWSKETFATNQGERYLNKKITLKQHLVGFLICQVVLDEATLFNIAIHPDAQKQGLASALLTQLITELEDKNIRTLWLEVRASNRAAIALYLHMGFNEITIRKNYYPTAQGREDAIIMAYTILL
ncbi:ribosomal protein S18-alanine N-acetyltransferase [Orbus sturtevantii]|uniref:ribosomal protein S18-alanine N-acetyltransferase n=1 Tax=Orbus sturtevantii TaxID=3074109 RepID=UPI00370DC88A